MASNLEIVVVNRETNGELKEKLINKSTLIIYVNSSLREIESIDSILKIGKTSLDFEFDRLHFVDKYRSKCIDIAFDLNRTRKSRSNKNSNKTVDLTNKTYYFSASSSSKLNDKNCFYLPEENRKLLQELLEPNTNMSSSTTSSFFLVKWLLKFYEKCYLKFALWRADLSLSTSFRRNLKQTRRRRKIVDDNLDYHDDDDDDNGEALLIIRRESIIWELEK